MTDLEYEINALYKEVTGKVCMKYTADTVHNIREVYQETMKENKDNEKIIDDQENKLDDADEEIQELKNKLKFYKVFTSKVFSRLNRVYHEDDIFFNNILLDIQSFQKEMKKDSDDIDSYLLNSIQF